MECDTRLKQIEEELSGFSASSFSTFASESEPVYTTLGNEIKSVLEYINNPNIWDDSIEDAYGNTFDVLERTRTGLSEIPSRFEPIGPLAESLVTDIKEYMKELENVNKLENDYSYYVLNEEKNKPTKPLRRTVNSDDEETAREANKDYQKKMESYNAWFTKQGEVKKAYSDASDKVQELLNTCYVKINQINEILGGEAEIPEATGASMDGLTPKHRTETDKDGNTVNITEWYDEKGKKVKEEQIITNKEGKQINRIRRTFYGNGKIKTEDKDYHEGQNYKVRGFHREYDENGKQRVLSCEEIEYENGTRVINARSEFYPDGKEVTTKEEVIHPNGTRDINVREELANGKLRVRTIEEEIWPNGDHNYNIREEYEEDGAVVQTIDRREEKNGTVMINVRKEFDSNKVMRKYSIEEEKQPDGTRIINSCEEYDESGKIRLKTTEEEIWSGGDHNYNIRDEYEEDGSSVMTIEKQVNEKTGTIHNKLRLEYDENGHLRELSCEETEYEDGTRIIKQSSEYDEEGNMQSDTAEAVILPDGTPVEYEDYVNDTGSGSTQNNSNLASLGGNQAIPTQKNSETSLFGKGLIGKLHDGNKSDTPKTLDELLAGAKHSESFKDPKESSSYETYERQDGQGNRSEIVNNPDHGGADEKIYDPSGKLIGEKSYVIGEDGKILRTTEKIYDPDGKGYTLIDRGKDGNVYKERHVEEQQTTSNSSLQNSQLGSTTASQIPKDKIEYYGNGNVKSKTEVTTTKNSVSVDTYDYDTDGKLTGKTTVYNSSNSSQNIHGVDKITYVNGKEEVTSNTTYAIKDKNGNVSQTIKIETLPDGGEYHQTFDSSGNLVRQETPDGSKHYYDYDSEGNRTGEIITNTSQDGVYHETSIGSDGAKIELEEHPDGTYYRRTFDSSGNLTQHETPDGIFNYEYDAAGNRTKETFSWVDQNGVTHVSDGDSSGI